MAVPFLKDALIPLGVIGFLAFGTLVMVGASNAVNLTDGLDGLAIGPVIMASAVFGFIAYVALKLATARFRDIHPAVAILAVLFVIKYMVIG